MKTLVKLATKKELEKVILKGIEIVEFKTGTNGTDFKGLEFRDTLTNSRLRVELGPYSDLNVFTEKQKEFTEKFRLSAKLELLSVNCDFDSKESAEQYAKEHNLSEVKIEPISVEKE